MNRNLFIIEVILIITADLVFTSHFKLGKTPLKTTEHLLKTLQKTRNCTLLQFLIDTSDGQICQILDSSISDGERHAL